MGICRENTTTIFFFLKKEGNYMKIVHNTGKEKEPPECFLTEETGEEK